MTGQLGGATPVRVSELVPPPGDLRRTAVLVAVTVSSVVAATVTAATRHPWATFVLLSLSAVSEAAVDGDGFVRWVRRRLGAGTATGAAARGLVVTLAVTRTTSGAVVVGTVVTVLTCVALMLLAAATAEAVARERRPTILTRNVPLDLRVPRAPHPFVGAWAAQASVPVTAAAVAAAAHTAAVAALLTLATLLAATPGAVGAAHFARLRRARVRAAVTAAATTALREQQPRVLLYFAGAPEEVYQLDMWLDPVERCGAPAAVLVRDPEVLRRLAATSLPVYCAEHNGTVASLPLPGRVVVLFPTHSGNNLSMLRRPETTSVFVGHGDSDKPDSSNPYARVYDEIWVAGAVGRTRYVDAGLGIRAEAVVEVGRPQLPQAWPAPPPPVTVLYAPTWEGWGDDPHHTSLPHVGPQLVRCLLAAGVRVVYRPHPLTGVRNVVVRRAHAEVVALLQRAGAQTLGGGTTRGGTGDGDGPARDRDLLDVAIRTSQQPTSQRLEPQPPHAVPALASPSHLVVLPEGAPTLHQTFAVAHALVGDVSSVVSEWLATQRPYAMPDTRAVGDAVFRRMHPSAGAATVLGADLAGLDDLLTAAGGGDDPLREQRQVTRRQVLGPPEAAEAFAAAVRAALTRSPRRPSDVAAP